MTDVQECRQAHSSAPTISLSALPVSGSGSDFSASLREGEKQGWFHGIWKVSRAKTAGTHKEGGSMVWEREEKQLLCVEEGPEERSRVETIRRHIRPPKQTKNHGVSFVSETHVTHAWIFGGNSSFAGQKQWCESRARSAILKIRLLTEDTRKISLVYW